MRPTPLLDTITRIVVVRNKASTYSAQAEAYIAALQNAWPDKQVAKVEVRSGEEAGNRQRLLRALRTENARKQLIIVAGGDGSVHYVMKTLLHPDTPAAYRHLPFTAWPLGNANDFYNSVHDRRGTRNPLSILTSPGTRLVKVHPLAWHITEGSTTRQEFALCYGTLGVSADVTLKVSLPEHRSRRQGRSRRAALMLDAAQGSPALWLPARFSVVLDSQQLHMTEMQFINGPLMSMAAHYNIRLSEQAMFVSITEKNDPLTVVAGFIRMGLGAMRGKRLSSIIRFSLESDKPVPAQVDGEFFSISNGSVAIGPSKDYVTIWATKDV